MSTDNASIVAARAEVERTRARLVATAREVQARLSPQTLVGDLWDSAKEKGAGIAEEAVDAVRKRPMVAGGVIAALALFLGRDPLMDMAAKVLNGKDKPAKPAKPAKRAARAKPRKTSKPKVTARLAKTESVE